MPINPDRRLFRQWNCAGQEVKPEPRRKGGRKRQPGERSFCTKKLISAVHGK